jgi:hypothetical protein
LDEPPVTGHQSLTGRGLAAETGEKIMWSQQYPAPL